MPYDSLALLHFFLDASVTVFTVGSKLSAVASCATSPRNRCAFRHETCELALERLDCASAPVRRRETGTRGRERCRLRLFPIHRRCPAPPTRVRLSVSQSRGSYLCRWAPGRRHGPLRLGWPRALSAAASC